MSEGVIGSGCSRLAFRTVVWPGGSPGAERVGVPEPARLLGVLPDLLLEVPVEVELRLDRGAAEAVVAVGGVQEAAFAPLVVVVLDDGPRPLLAHAGHPRQGLEVPPVEEVAQLVRLYGLGGLRGGPLVHAAHELQHPLDARRADAAPEVVDLAHRREGVVVLPVPDELPHPLDRRPVLGHELDGHPVADVPAVGPRHVLRREHHLHLDRRRVEGEAHGNARRDLLQQPPAEHVVFEIRIKHWTHILPSDPDFPIRNWASSWASGFRLRGSRLRGSGYRLDPAA
jgi:hypothetical protein